MSQTISIWEQEILRECGSSPLDCSTSYRFPYVSRLKG